MTTATQKVSQTHNPFSFIFDFFKRSNTNTLNSTTIQITDHQSEVAQAWSSLEQSYSRLHTALDELEAKEGDVIEFAHLAQVLNLPSDLIQNYFDTVCFTCID